MTAVAGGDRSAVVSVAPNKGVRRSSVQLALFREQKRRHVIVEVAYARCSLGRRVRAQDGPTIK